MMTFAPLTPNFRELYQNDTFLAVDHDDDQCPQHKHTLTQSKAQITCQPMSLRAETSLTKVNSLRVPGWQKGKMFVDNSSDLQSMAHITYLTFSLMALLSGMIVGHLIKLLCQ